MAVPAMQSNMKRIPPARIRKVPTPKEPILIGSTSIRNEFSFIFADVSVLGCCLLLLGSFESEAKRSSASSRWAKVPR
jgi:hypothetical protein